MTTSAEAAASAAAARNENTSAILPALAGVLLAAQAQQAGSLTARSALSHVDEMLGITARTAGVLGAIAMRAIAALARTKGLPPNARQALQRAAEDPSNPAVQRAVQAGVQTIATAVRQRPHPPARETETEPLELEPPSSPAATDARVLAERTAQAVHYEAQQAAAENAELVAAEERSNAELPPDGGVLPAAWQFRKTWHSRRDARVRASHAFLGSQSYEFHTVDLADPFVSITGALIRYPCDPLAPPAETYRCRCWLTFHVAPVPARATAVALS